MVIDSRNLKTSFIVQLKTTRARLVHKTELEQHFRKLLNFGGNSPDFPPNLV